ncbi:MAG: hypothetical protein H0X49_11755, partial [Acidobacteria bacterium]|nr:hypothetical protein [Acidobacteriota bacterium]
RDAGAKLAPLMENSPALTEAKPLAQDLQKLAAIGLEALTFIKSKNAPSAEWRDKQFAELDQIAKPKAALEFAVVSPVRLLISAAFEMPNRKNTSATEWRERIRKSAAPSVPPKN